MNFLYPECLLSLLLIPLLAGLAFLMRRRARHAWRMLVSPVHPYLVFSPPEWRRVLPPVLLLLSLACTVLALARPFNGYESDRASASGRNLLIALDISRSMETTDVAPSRLEEARAAAYELVDALPNDKLGLIVFSGEADLVVPLTHDHTALRDALEQVNRDWEGSGGTNFDQAIRCAISAFARSAQNGSNAIVILSDGEDTVDTPLTAARDARKKNILVITVGVGTPAGGPIPDPSGDNGLWQDASGKHVISKLNSPSLQRFAQASGGDFFLMSTGADLSAFARKTASKLTEHEENFDAGRSPRDLFAWFALPALLLAVAGILLGSAWRPPRLRFPVLLALSLPFTPETSLAQSRPSDAYAAGLSALKANKPDEARGFFSDALLSDNPELQAAAHLALGNQRARACFDKLRKLYDASAPPPTAESLQQIVDELQSVLPSYSDALRANPHLSQAISNTSEIRKLIDKLKNEIERLKNQQDKQDKQNEDNRQDKQDGQVQQNQGDDRNKQNKSQKPNHQSKDDKKNPQDSQERQDGEKPQDKRDKADRSDQQDNPERQEMVDGQEEQNQRNNRNQQPPEDKQEQQEKPSQNKQDSNQQQGEDQQPGLSDEEKKKQRASGILRMHTDEVGGSPIPHRTKAARPLKDY